MRFLGWVTAISAWLLVSAFALPNAPRAEIFTVVAAFAAPVFAALAIGRPWARFVITGIAAVLALAALLVPAISRPAAISDVLVAAALAAVSLVNPLHARTAAPPQVPAPKHN